MVAFKMTFRESLILTLAIADCRVQRCGCSGQILESVAINAKLKSLLANSMSLEQRLNRVTVILSDVDGVMTDGGIGFDNNGVEYKQFHVRDGLGIKLWQKAGFRFGILTARNSRIVEVRADELGIDIVRQGFADKLTAGKEMAAELGCELEEICFIGDDLTDLPIMRCVGLAATVADGAAEVREIADFQTAARGGQGAIRELVERILKAQDRWDELIQKYYVNETGPVPS